MLPLSNMQRNTPVLNLWEQQLGCKGIMFDALWYILTFTQKLLLNNIYLGQLGFQPSKEMGYRFSLNYYIQSLIFIWGNIHQLNCYSYSAKKWEAVAFWTIEYKL